MTAGIFILAVFVSGCGNNNKSLFQQQETLDNNRKNVFSSNLNIEQPLSQPQNLTLNIGSNTQVGDINLLAVPTVPAPVSKMGAMDAGSSNIIITQKAVINDSKESFNPMTYLYYAVALFLLLVCIFILYWYLKVLKTKFSLMGGGIALDSITRFITNEKAKTTDAGKMTFLTEFELEILNKIKRLEEKK